MENWIFHLNAWVEWVNFLIHLHARPFPGSRSALSLCGTQAHQSKLQASLPHYRTGWHGERGRVSPLRLYRPSWENLFLSYREDALLLTLSLSGGRVEVGVRCGQMNPPTQWRILESAPYPKCFKQWRGKQQVLLTVSWTRGVWTGTLCLSLHPTGTGTASLSTGCALRPGLRSQFPTLSSPGGGGSFK